MFLSERCQSGKAAYCMIPTKRHSGKGKTMKEDSKHWRLHTWLFLYLFWTASLEENSTKLLVSPTFISTMVMVHLTTDVINLLKYTFFSLRTSFNWFFFQQTEFFFEFWHWEDTSQEAPLWACQILIPKQHAWELSGIIIFFGIFSSCYTNNNH